MPRCGPCGTAVVGVVELRLVESHPIHQLARQRVVVTDEPGRGEIIDDAKKLTSPRPVPLRVFHDPDPGSRRHGRRRPLIGQRPSYNALNRRAVASALALVPRPPHEHAIIVVNCRAPRQAEPPDHDRNSANVRGFAALRGSAVTTRTAQLIGCDRPTSDNVRVKQRLRRLSRSAPLWKAYEGRQPFRMASALIIALP